MRLNEFIEPIACFFHGSDVGDLMVLEPRESGLVDEPVVFAATLPEIAVAMTGHWSDDDFEFGHDTSTKPETEFPPYTFRELRPGVLQKFFTDRSVYLYQVPADQFSHHDNLQDFEVISKDDVHIHSMIEVKNPLAYIQGSPYLKVIEYENDI